MAMSSIMRSYKEYVKEMKDQQETFTRGRHTIWSKDEQIEDHGIYIQGHHINTPINEQREELMLKGRNHRNTYSLERVCLADDRKR